MWHGADNDPIFTQGWALCNGQGNTPDLRDRFVVGRGNSYPAGEALGEATKTLGTANLPSHTHTDGTLTGSGGAHSHGTVSYTHLTLPTICSV